MPFVETGGHRTYFRMDGRDHAPVLVLSHSLGLDHGMWDEQVADLLPHLRLLRYDTRGHGASSVHQEDYTVAMLGRDVLALADALRIEQFAFCGLSLGGLIGQWLALHAPDRVTRLVLANTSHHPDGQAMETRRRTVIGEGMTGVAETVMGRFFSPATLVRQTPRTAWARRMLLATDPAGYAGCCAAVRDWDGTPQLHAIRVPTLVIAGTRDVSMPWEVHSRPLAEQIPHVRFVRLEAAHLSNIEAPRAFSVEVADFLLDRGSSVRDAGSRVRRQVLGDAHVDRAEAATTDFTREFQELITTYAWGTIWTRPGLDVRTRRLLVLAITAAQGRWEEFRLHLKSGLAQDLEPADVKEVLLQVAVYAGVPAANTAFKIAVEEGAGSDTVNDE
jgi:3-oxoadipate enol-lactonase / 4-carboxymuconolactone decarboxylase